MKTQLKMMQHIVTSLEAGTVKESYTSDTVYETFGVVCRCRMAASSDTAIRLRSSSFYLILAPVYLTLADFCSMDTESAE